jgi:DNA-binding NarL/FixJ family response regulator
MPAPSNAPPFNASSSDSTDAARIFVVEDHETMRLMLDAYLSREDDFVVCRIVETAEAAIEQIADAQPSLMLIDVSLPQMSGLDLVRWVREHHPDLPTLVLSGHGERRYVRNALEAGADGYILKGDMEQVPLAIRQVLRGEQYLSPELEM